MGKRIQYRGLFIDPHIYELAGGLGWGAEVYIETHDGSGVTVDQFILTTQYRTEREADDAAYSSGQRIIDERLKS